MVSLRLVCDGRRAKAGSSLQQGGNNSLIPELTHTAELYARGVNGLQDGKHQAVYKGRGSHRDVYRIKPNLIMKLSTDSKERSFHSNQLEAEALTKTQTSSQTPVLYHRGRFGVETKSFRSTAVNSISLTVDCVLMSYG